MKDLKEHIVEILESYKVFEITLDDNIVVNSSINTHGIALYKARKQLAIQILHLISEQQKQEAKDRWVKAHEDYLMTFEQPADYPYDKLIEIASGHKEDEYIDDGFGNKWNAYCPKCGKRTMQVVRPGKVQCSKCN